MNVFTQYRRFGANRGTSNLESLPTCKKDSPKTSDCPFCRNYFSAVISLFVLLCKELFRSCL